jgi:hypothetical protein
MRVHMPDGSVAASGDVAGPDLVPLGGFVTAPFGTNLAVAWGHEQANAPPDILLSVIGETGGTVVGASIPHHFSEPLSLVSAPTGDGLVLAWHEPAGPDGATAVRLARFDCSSL